MLMENARQARAVPARIDTAALSDIKSFVHFVIGWPFDWSNNHIVSANASKLTAEAETSKPHRLKNAECFSGGFSCLVRDCDLSVGVCGGGEDVDNGLG
jgi:hypothetical protein